MSGNWNVGGVSLPWWLGFLSLVIGGVIIAVAIEGAL